MAEKSFPWSRLTAYTRLSALRISSRPRLCAQSKAVTRCRVTWFRNTSLLMRNLTISTCPALTAWMSGVLPPTLDSRFMSAPAVMKRLAAFSSPSSVAVVSAVSPNGVSASMYFSTSSPSISRIVMMSACSRFFAAQMRGLFPCLEQLRSTRRGGAGVPGRCALSAAAASSHTASGIQDRSWRAQSPPLAPQGSTRCWQLTMWSSMDSNGVCVPQP
mmetsp:Transcript_22050/g.67722  ORF Transcript_22050/g.67722 Transcript_22050/m.67722 type:complete len:216 (-) Transcript_22050:1835-2482(-)